MERKPTYEELEQRVRELENAPLERKQEEKAQKRALALLQKSEDIGKSGCWSLDLQSNREVWSHGEYHLHGLSKDLSPSYELHLQCVHPEDREQHSKAFNKHLASDKTHFSQEYRIQTKNGTTKHVQASYQIVRDGSGRALSASGTDKDITERKQAEGALRKSENTLKIAQSVGKIGSWWYDPVTQMPTWTEEMFHIFGLEPRPTALPYEEHRKIIHPDDWELFDTSVNKAVNEGVGYNIELRITHPNGEFRRVNARCVAKKNADGIVTELIGTTQDITERKLFEEALRDSEDRYREILENVLVGVYQATLDGKFIFANQKMIQMFGYSSYEELEAIGSIAELYARPEERSEVVDKIIVDGFIHREVEYKHKDGQSVWVKLHTRKSKNKEGSIILEGLAEDVTEIRKIEAQLQQSQKMEAVGTLSGGIAHDFNNILAIILGNAELASDDVPDGNPATENLEEIRLASIRAKDMVQQLLSFSRKTDEKSKPLNVVPVIKESMKMLRSTIPTSVEFRQHLSDDPCNIMGDAAQLNQILMNLITNATHAMSEEGLIEMTLKKVRLMEEKSCFDWILSPGDYVNLNVRDTGEGMAPETMARIFEPYYTTKEVGKGTGMGLSVIHGIMKRHNGGIRVESELGKGTVFEIYFPALEEMREEGKEPEGEIKGGSESILFVDDEDSLVNLNCQRLERLGYQVKSTTRPLEAMEWFKADPDQFDVVITDMTMPGMTGDRLATEILAIRPEMLVILCTGYTERLAAKEAEALGFRKYLEKPIGARKLATVLREVLDQK